MSLKSARIHNFQLSESLSNRLEKIWGRISRGYTPMWLLTELDYMRQQARDIQSEFKRQLNQGHEKK